MIYAGIDIGSRTIKTVLFDTDAQAIVAHELWDQGVDQDGMARAQYANLLKDAGLEPDGVTGLVATGYGRNAIAFADTAITEITCHAAGVRHLHPDVQTIIDIGGEDSKIMRLDPRGRVQDFVMNDRCAAGTGRFLEIVAKRLEGDLHAVARASRACASPAAISSMCVVFAETEIIGLLASGASKEDIMAGVQVSIASRVHSMVGRHAKPPFYFTGGVALVPGMAEAMAGILKQPVTVSDYAQLTGALGAAILASKRIR
ncbi:MAG: acyl-CoA dehydratase activase [Phycisphaerae bacterium]|nr:acyl-CoA dehydratase activase [Phycisphaerae bacterium]